MKLRIVTGLLLLASSIWQPAWASTANVSGKIVTLSGGWNDPNLRVVLDNTTFVNPDGCTLTDGYIISASLAANQQFTAMAISAYSMKERVTLVVSGCTLDRPSIIGFTFGGQ